jgi:hypothetical protein
MNHFKQTLLATIILAATAFAPASAKNYMVPKAYMFGFIASFNDSIVFFTDVQEVDSVWLQPKKQMLAGRANYAQQLRDFFSTNFSLNNRTCVVISSTKRKDVEKKYQKMIKQYTVKNANKYDVHYVNASEFKFRPVNMDDSDEQPAPEPKKKDKKDKKDKKSKAPKGSKPNGPKPDGPRP